MYRSCLVWIWLLCLGCSREPEGLHLVLGGDVLLDRGVRAAVRGPHHGDPAQLFGGIAPLLRRADYALVNLESPVTHRQTPLPKRFVFRGEPSWLPALKQAGITHVSMANNHTNDQGRQGLADTYQHLQQAGIGVVGGGPDGEQACAPLLLDGKGVRVAVFASVLMPLESWVPFSDRPTACQSSPDRLLAAVKTYKRRNPSDKVLVFVHWGVEYAPRPQPWQRLLARGLVDAGAAAVVGHHPHVQQGSEVYKQSPIYYSLGNLVFDQHKEVCRQGNLLSLYVTEQGVRWKEHPYRIGEGCRPEPQ